VAEIVISPSNPNVMYAGFEVNVHSLYKSTDAGKTWKRIDGGGDHTKDIAISPKNPNKVYFAMSEPVETTDTTIRATVRSDKGRFGGATNMILVSGESAGPSESSFSTIEIFEQNDKIIYAALKGGGVEPFGTIKPKIFKTTNGGSSWTDLIPDLKDVNVIAIHPTNHNLIYVGSGDGIYVSKDSGKTLKKLKATRVRGGFISIELQLDNPNVIYIASSSEVFKTEDSGVNWKDIKGQLSDIHRVRVSRSNPNILYASTFNGVFRSDDFGETWQDKTSNLKAKNIQIVTIHPNNPDIAFIGHSNLWSSVRAELRFEMALLANQGIYKTTNGGNSWFRSDEGIFEYDLEEVAVSPHNPNEAWVASIASRGGFKTIDAAHNWRTTQIQTLHYPMRIKYSMQEPDKIYITSWHQSGPFGLSEDGGASWKLTNEEEYFKGLNRGLSLYDKNQKGHIHVHGLAVDPNDDSIVYSGSVKERSRQGDEFPLEGAHIFKSTDTGKTWTESDEGFPHEKHTAIHDIQIDSQNTNVIYVTTTKHEALEGLGIYKSTDAGKTWKAVNNGLSGRESLNVGALTIHPENTQLLIAATGSGLYKSTNAGSSWKRTSSSKSFDVEHVKQNPDIVYASTNDGVLKSKDFGDTWYNVNFGLPKGEGQGIGVGIDGNVIYTAVKGEGAYVARIKPVQPIEPVSVFSGKGFDFAMDFGGPPGFDDFKGIVDDFFGDEESGPDEHTGPLTLEECRQYEMPEDCNTLQVPDIIISCEECKVLIAAEEEEIPEQEEEEEEIEVEIPEEEEIEIPEEPSFFERIINFFKNLFGGSKEVEEKVDVETQELEQNITQEEEEVEEIVEEELSQISEKRQGKISQKKEKNLLSQISEECSKTSKVPSFGYQGLLTEVHVHTSQGDNPGKFAINLLQEMNENGVDRIVIQPIHDPRGYNPQNKELDETWGEINAVCPRIIPLIYGFNPDEEDAWEYVKERLDTGNYGGVGEIEFQHGNLPIKYDPKSKSMLKIYDMLEEKGLPLHFQASFKTDPSLGEKIFRIISSKPKINFIWFGCPFNDKFMSLPNLYCDSFFHSQTYIPKGIHLRKNLIATDSSAKGFSNSAYSELPYNSFGEAMVEARNALADLKKSDADAIANKNFDKIWPKSLFKAKPVEEVGYDEDYEDDYSDQGSIGGDDLSNGQFGEEIHDSGLEEECASTPWPPDCSFIPDELERNLCEQCKAIG